MAEIKAVIQHLGVLQNNDIRNIFEPIEAYLGNQKNNTSPVSIGCITVCKDAMNLFLTYKEDVSNSLAKRIATTIKKRMEKVFGTEMMKKWEIKSKIYFRLGDDELDIEVYINPV